MKRRRRRRRRRRESLVFKSYSNIIWMITRLRECFIDIRHSGKQASKAGKARAAAGNEIENRGMAFALAGFVCLPLPLCHFPFFIQGPKGHSHSSSSSLKGETTGH